MIHDRRESAGDHAGISVGTTVDGEEAGGCFTINFRPCTQQPMPGECGGVNKIGHKGAEAQRSPSHRWAQMKHGFFDEA